MNSVVTGFMWDGRSVFVVRPSGNGVGAADQNTKRATNWIRRGRLAWPVIWPNVELLAVLFGAAKTAWFTRLKPSALICKLRFSPRLNFFCSEAATSLIPSLRTLENAEANVRTWNWYWSAVLLSKGVPLNALPSTLRGCELRSPPRYT